MSNKVISTGGAFFDKLQNEMTARFVQSLIDEMETADISQKEKDTIMKVGKRCADLFGHDAAMFIMFEWEAAP